MTAKALSWPAPPFNNAFIETACGMLSDHGVKVRTHNPTFWTTPLQTADLYVIHWPDAIFWNKSSKQRLWFRIARVLTNLALLKARGTRILWFVHNLQPHDLLPARQHAWTVYAGHLSRLVDGWITLSPSTADPVLQRYPHLAQKRHTFLWHPPYADAYGGTPTEARSELGLKAEKTLFGHAGLLRPYKNLVDLAARFERITPENSVLLLTGKAKRGTDDQLTGLSETVERLDYREGKLSPKAFDRALTAIDVFVAPYAQFLHSGALIHALSRGCVVVAPRAPFTRDLEALLGEDWVVLFEGEIDADVMSCAAAAAGRTAGQSPDLSALMPAANQGRLRDLLEDMGIECCD